MNPIQFKLNVKCSICVEFQNAVLFHCHFFLLTKNTEFPKMTFWYFLSDQIYNFEVDTIPDCARSEFLSLALKYHIINDLHISA